METLDYLNAALQFMAVGGFAGVVSWLLGFTVFSVFGFLNIAVDNPADV